MEAGLAYVGFNVLQGVAFCREHEFPTQVGDTEYLHVEKEVPFSKKKSEQSCQQLSRAYHTVI